MAARFEVQYQIPRRANIYDREGKGLAVEGKLVTVGIVPGDIEDEAALLAGLSPIVKLSPDDIKAKYAGARADWFVPIADISFETSQTNNDVLKTPGLATARERSSRIYTGIAPLAIGYISQITQDNLADWKARGYRGDEWVGTSGLEAWGEPYLAGTHGGKLTHHRWQRSDRQRRRRCAGRAQPQPLHQRSIGFCRKRWTTS